VNSVVIAKRELAAFLAWPLAYLLGAIFLFITGLSFVLTLAFDGTANLNPVFQAAGMALLFIAPLLTMRLLSEETRSGTLELLLTSPVSDAEVVWGKFLASLLFLIVMLAPTLVYPFLLIHYSSPVILLILSSYGGVILLGALLLGIGMLTSAVVTHKIAAAGWGMGLALTFWLASHRLAYFSIQEHFFNFVLGLINLSSVCYFLSLTTALLLATTCVLKKRRGCKPGTIVTMLGVLAMLVLLNFAAIRYDRRYNLSGIGPEIPALVVKENGSFEELTKKKAVIFEPIAPEQGIWLNSTQVGVMMFTMLIFMPLAVLAVGGVVWLKQR
jgi:ABC-2 type transport system permease protein